MTLKRIISLILPLVCSLTGYAQSAVDNDLSMLDPDDKKLFINAIGMVDDGMSEAVIPDFDYLVSKYPKCYIVRYERAYNNYILKRYDEVLKDEKSLLKHPCADERAYQLIGNTYDLKGEPQKAHKVYRNGLKHFPHSGTLNMEIGTLYWLAEDYNNAVEYYNLGIVAEPDFASNYYRAAMIYLCTDVAKVWGLMYAESAILLAPSNESRHKELAEGMLECLNQSITMSFDDQPQMSVKLVPMREIKIDDMTKTVYLDFQGVYEAAIMKPLMKMQISGIPFAGTIPPLADIRRGAVENYFTVTDNLYGSSMYLLEFQKKVIDADHWDAYNYYIFMPSHPKEFSEWYDTHKDDFETFVDWYNSAPFTLGDGCSVDTLQIFNHYRPLDMREALLIQAKLVAADSPAESDE